MHQHLALERRDRWIRAAASSRQASESEPAEPAPSRAPARRLGRLPLLRIAR